jgi:hypothetical protein
VGSSGNVASAFNRFAEFVSELRGELAIAARLTRDLPSFYRRTVSLDQAAAWHRDRIRSRPQRFLGVAERHVYANARSPYLRLLKAAGCEFGDLRTLIEREGLEGALDDLRERGVYVTSDEFRGRREIIRGSLRLTPNPDDFDNPLQAAHFEALTGGTSGQRARVRRSLDLVEEVMYSSAVSMAAHGLSRTPHAVWETGPAMWLLRMPRLGTPLAAWFYPLQPLPWRVRLGAIHLALLAGLFAKYRLPLPVHCDLQEPRRVAEWLADRSARGQTTCLVTHVSSAVRVAAESTRSGRSLAGVTFFVRSEPLTPARKRTIEASGARAMVNYGATEASVIGISCAEPTAPDDVHVFESRYAITRRSRSVPFLEQEVEALLATSLTDGASKVLINVETGDYADVWRGPSDCCAMGRLGMTMHLSSIRSFEKLTSEGMTFIGSNVVRILEEQLPSRFGGNPIDYQLVEHEHADSTARLSLRVHPDIGPIDEDALRSAFLESLAMDGVQERYMSAFWGRAKTVQIDRAPPITTPSGKVLPFRLLRVSN